MIASKAALLNFSSSWFWSLESHRPFPDAVHVHRGGLFSSQILAQLSLESGDLTEADLTGSLPFPPCYEGVICRDALVATAPTEPEGVKTLAFLIKSFNLWTRLLQEFRTAYRAVPSLPRANVLSSQDFQPPLTTVHGSERQQRVSKSFLWEKKKTVIHHNEMWARGFQPHLSVILWEKNLFCRVSVKSLPIQ